ncbi:MAG: hypothetical protein HY365_00200 [Candidatus Aenigmarchaeota archaeon]|nr:hypothetical protein [Candidatus Aenigmarchaeota archaeon]
MPIMGSNFSKIEAVNNEKKVSGGMNVNGAPKIVGVRKHDKVFDIKNVLSIDYVYETKYEPDAGHVRIEGEMLYSTERADQIVSLWSKEKKLDDDMAVDVLNAIFRQCIAKTIEIAADLRLPPPIEFPNVKKEEKK